LKRRPHLLVAISSHGYGHLAQCAPVINELCRRSPNLRLTLYSAIPTEVLASRIGHEFAHWRGETDAAMPMLSAWKVDAERVPAAYARMHEHWEADLRREAAHLERLAPDLVLANVPYRLLVAARRTGIPSVALCSLNWAAVYAAYCGTQGPDAAILRQMQEGYRAAGVFLAPRPALPMPEIPACESVGPIARTGRARRATLRRLLGVGESERLVLIALGGVATLMELGRWPRFSGVRWLLPEGLASVDRPDMMDIRDLDVRFIDVLASSDAVLAKPGYGTFVEAACNGIPVLYIARPDWPETPFLVDWLRRHGRCREIRSEQFINGVLADDLECLWAVRRPAPMRPTGHTEAADVIASLLG
jgi:hypothetical protein